MINLDWWIVSHIAIVVSILWLFLITLYLRKENGKLRAKLNSKRWVKFNINEKVKVRVTHVGEDILRGHREDLNAWIKENGSGRGFYGALYSMDTEGYASLQLYEMMLEFGPHLLDSKGLPIETEIMLEIQESDDD